MPSQKTTLQRGMSLFFLIHSKNEQYHFINRRELRVFLDAGTFTLRIETRNCSRDARFNRPRL
jgi:hypothetical protein